MQRGKTGTSMSIERRPSRTGTPRLKFPKQPNPRYFYSEDVIFAEVERLRSSGKTEEAAEMAKTESYERVMDKWKKECDTIRAAYQERTVAHLYREKMESAKHSGMKRQEIDRMEALGLPLPRHR